MKTSILLFLICTSILSYSQEEISGITPKAKITVNNSQLVLNGAGLREKIFLDLYVGSLYLVNKTNNAKQIIDKDETMAITIDIVSSLISSEKMIEAINEGFEKSTKGNVSPISKEIASFKSAFSEEIVKSDHYTIAYTKGLGTTVSKNGKQTTSIKGFEFKKALFGIWLGEEPADEDLKEGMLGLN